MKKVICALFTLFFVFSGAVCAFGAETTAFAVYSADDTSLTFYNREYVPTAGEIFENRTATAVYTGFDTGIYADDEDVPWTLNRAKVTSVEFADEITPVSTAYWFYSFTALEEFISSGLNTAGTEDMSYMFYNCNALTCFDLSDFSTASATTMKYMFRGCSKLTSLDLSSFNTATVTNMAGMFYGCTSLTTIYVTDGDWSVASVTDSANMFNNCTKLLGCNGTYYATGYNAAIVTADYAVIDSEITPGYLSDIDDPPAFAVYSADDSSLTFYQGIMPTVGEYFDGKVVTAVYPCPESATFTSASLVPWYANRANIKRISFSEEIAPVSTAHWFYGFTALEDFNGSNLNTSETTSMEAMFSGCTTITKLDLRDFNTESVTNAKSMFNGCTALTTIYVADGSWSTASITDSSKMFTSCTKLVGGNGTRYNTSYVTADYAIIDTATTPGYLTDIANPPAFAVYSADDSSLTFYQGIMPSIGAMFRGKTVTATYPCPEGATFTSANAVPWYANRAIIKKVSFAEEIMPVSTAYWFYGFTVLEEFNSRNLNTCKTTNMSYMFHSCRALTTLDLSRLNTATVENMAFMFYSCRVLANLNISNFNTANVTNMASMFYDCRALLNLNLSSFNTANVENMSSMFYGCTKLTTIYVTNGEWSTASVTSHSQMFYNCSKIVGGNNTRYSSNKVTKTQAVIDTAATPGYLTDIANPPAFAVYSADDGSLTFYQGIMPSPGMVFKGKIVTAVYPCAEGAIFTGTSSVPWYANRGNIKTVSFAEEIMPVSTAYWFYGFTALEEFSGNNLNTSKTTNMSYMFSGCSVLANLDLENFNTANVTTMAYMFRKCIALTSLDLSSFSTASLTNMAYTFNGCTTLTTIYVDPVLWSLTASSGISGTRTFTSCSKLVGGNGTRYSNVTPKYAILDGKDGQPGYMTEITPATPVITAQPVGSTEIYSGEWINTSVKLTFAIPKGNPDSIEEYKYSLDDGASWKTASGFTIEDEGKHKVIAKAVSVTGLESPVSEEFLVNVDKTAPTYTLTRSETDYTTNDITLTFACTDEASGFDSNPIECTFAYADGSFGWFGSMSQGAAGSTPPVAMAVTQDVKMKDNGTCTITIRDRAGNETIETITVDNIDRVPPATPVITARRAGTTAINSGAWINASAVLSITSAGGNASGIAEYKYSMDGGYTWKTGNSVTITAEGAHSVLAKVISNTGVESELSEEFLVYVDKTAPVVTVEKLYPDGFITSDNELIYTVTDDFSGFSDLYSYDGKYHFEYNIAYKNGTTEGPVRRSWDDEAGFGNITMLENGTCTVTVYDDAGNKTTVASVVNNIDRDTPAAPLAYAIRNGNLLETGTWVNDSMTVYFYQLGDVTGDGFLSKDDRDIIARHVAKIATQSYPLTLMKMDANSDGVVDSGDLTLIDQLIDLGNNVSGVAAYKYSVDGGYTWVDGSSVTLSDEGEVTVLAKSISAAGFESEPAEVFQANIDKTPPTITYTTNPSDGSTATRVDFTFYLEDDVAGLPMYSFKITEYYNNGEIAGPFNCGDWHPEDFVLAGTVLRSLENNGTMICSLTDRAGNTTSETIVVNNVDRAKPNAPTISCIADSHPVYSGNWTTADEATLTFTAISNVPSGIAGYKYSLDGGKTWESGASVTVSDEGKYTIQAKSISGSGVESSVSTFLLNMDSTDPTYSLVRSETGYTSNNVTLTVTASDALSGFARMQFNYGVWVYASTETMTKIWDFVVSENGTYPLTVVDYAGNEITNMITVNNIDKAAPEAPTITATQGGARVIANGGWANGDITFTFSGTYTNLSGVKSYVYSLDNGQTWLNANGDSVTIISTVGEQSIIAKAVSTTGVESAVSEVFLFGIDRTAPTMTFAGNPTNWAQSATITVTPSDMGGSGVKSVLFYDDNGDPTTLAAPYEYTFTENGTYTFGVVDAAGNSSTKTVKITKVDSEAPIIEDGLPSVVEISTDRTYAILNLTVVDQGPSGIASVTLPDGSVTATTEIHHKLYENGEFVVSAVDRAGNVAEKTILVGGLILSDDTSLTASLYTNSGVDTFTLTHGEDHLFSTAGDDVNTSTLEFAAAGHGAKIASVDGVTVNAAKHTVSFTIPAETEKTFVVVVEAADGTTDTYGVTVSALNKSPQIVAILNATDIRKSWYTESGIVLERSFKEYSDGREGIEIQIAACDLNKGQYVSGFVTFNGIKYDFEWGSRGSGVLEYESQGEERKGYALIPVSAFYTGSEDADISEAYAYITLQDADSAGGDVISTSDSTNNNVRIRTDVTGPVIIMKSASTKYAVRIGLSDTTYINNVTVTLTPKNGANAGVPNVTEYSHSELERDYLYLEDGINYEITVTAVDVAGHTSTVTKSIGYSGGIANIGGVDGGGDDPDAGGDGAGGGDSPDYGVLEVDFDNTEGSVYSFKTRKANYYLIGGSGAGNTEAVKHLPNFQYFLSDTTE